MYDDLQVWFTLIQKFVSETAFIEDGRVYVKVHGIQEIPLYDPATFVALLNYNPHLLPATYEAWRINDENRIERGFCIALFEQVLQEEQMRKHISAEQITATAREAMQQIVQSLAAAGFVIMNETGDPAFDVNPVQAAPVADEPKTQSIFQQALFSSLGK